MNITAFNLRQTDAYRASVLKKYFFKPYSIIFYCIVLSPLAISEVAEKSLVPLGYGTLILGYILWVLHTFRRHLRKNRPNNSVPSNIAEMFSYHMVEHLMEKQEISSSTIVESALQSERGDFVLHQIGVEAKEILTAWSSQKIRPTFDTLVDWILEAKEELGTSTLDSTATIYAVFKNIPELIALLNNADISEKDVRTILASEAFHFEELQKRRHPFSPESIVRYVGSIGKSWVVGYNSELERLTENLSQYALGHVRSVQIHEKEMKSLYESISGGDGKNFLLIGPPGSGKRTLIRNLTASLRLHEMERGILFTDVLRLKTTTLLSGTEAGDRELLSALEKSSLGGRFILVIEDFTLLLAGSDPRLKNILFSLLQAKNIRTIAIATPQEYHASIKTNPGLDSLLEKILIQPPASEEVMRILFEEYFVIEQTRKIRIPERTLRSIVGLSERFLANAAMPAKAVEILREAVATVQARSEKIVTEEHIRTIVSQKAKINVQSLTTDERQKLLVLDERMSRHIIGQKQAISAIVHALRRARLDLGTRKRPMGTFLFLGTTGVGKTETAKALALEYFGAEECMIRIDMNDLSTEESVRTLVGGSGPEGFIEGMLTRRVQDMPFSLILLDEIEKAHPKVVATFLQILDEGILTDGAGMRTDFRSSIIIATSNAGSSFLAKESQEASLEAEFKKSLLYHIIEEKLFSPEFMNRFDEIIVFERPSKEDIERMTILMLDELIRTTNEKHGIRISVEQGVVDILAKRGFDPTFGAREMRRTITKSVEDYIADYMLQNTVKRGDEIVIRVEDVAND